MFLTREEQAEANRKLLEGAADRRKDRIETEAACPPPRYKAEAAAVGAELWEATVCPSCGKQNRNKIHMYHIDGSEWVCVSCLAMLSKSRPEVRALDAR